MEDHSDLASSKTATQKADSSKLLNVESGILALQRAAKDQSSNGYQASVSVVISGVRSLLSSYDCLARQTPVLLSHPLLVQLRRSILDVLATVVELARKCSSRLKSRDFEQYELDLVRMLQLSEEVLDFTQQFLTYAHENQIPSVEPTDKSIRGEGASTTPKSASKPAPQLQRHKTKSMGDLKTRRKLAEHAEQFQQISEATPRFTASNGSDASLWPPPSLSSAASSSDSLDGPKTPRDPKSQGTALDNLKDHLLSVIAAFIGHVHVHSRDSHASSYAHLVDIACEAVELVKELMAVVEELPAKSLDGGSCGSDAEDLASAREALYTSTNDLVTAVRIATDPPDPESEDSEDTEKATMLQSATRLLRSADSGVAHVKKCLHRSEAASKVFDLISHAPPYQNSAAEANTETAGKAKPDANPYHTAFLRERHTLSMLGRTADGLGHLKSRYEQGDAHPTTDPSSASDSESGRQPHSSHGSTASSTNQSNSESASVPQVRLQEFTPADIKPLNTLSNRRGQPSPTPLRIDTDAQPKKDPTPPSAFSASSVSQLQSAQSAQSAASAANSLANSGTSEETHRKESLQIEDALNRGYEAKEIMFNGDGQVTGGTLRCLVERMSLHDAPIDAGFAQAFFLTFRLFASPKDLTKALFSRFLLAPPERIAENSPEAQSWSRSVALPVKLRVINMFKTWLESHWQPETDGIILNPLADFAQEKIKPTNASAASRLIDLVQKRQYRPEELAQIQSLHQTVSNDRMRQGKPALDGVPLHLSTPMNEKFPATIFQVPPPPPAIGRMLLNACRSDTCTHISVTEFDPLEIARQLTIIDSRLFCMIQPKELFMQSKGKQRPSDSSNHVRQMSAQSTKITGWISEVILSEQDTKRRTQIMKWFLKLADVCSSHVEVLALFSDAFSTPFQRCHSLQNYNTLMAVLAALNSSTVARLRRTWEGLSAKYKMLLENLRKVTEHTRNYAEYRGALRRASQPALPFLGLYLTDLTFCHDGNPPTRTSSLDSSLKLINFDRYSVRTES